MVGQIIQLIAGVLLAVFAGSFWVDHIGVPHLMFYGGGDHLSPPAAGRHSDVPWFIACFVLGTAGLFAFTLPLFGFLNYGGVIVLPLVVLAEIGFTKLVILSTHIVSDVESIATQIAIMREGRLVTLAVPEELAPRLEDAYLRMMQVGKVMSDE